MKKFLFLLFAVVSVNTACNKLTPATHDNESQGSGVLEAVDLGLSVQWANMNVGASSIFEAGGYYAWGETSEKQSYAESNYKFYREEPAHYTIDTYIEYESGDLEFLSSSEKSEKVYSKYWTKDFPKEERSLIFVYHYSWIDFFPDHLTNLEIDADHKEKTDDCAFINLGKQWRMPTKDECLELVSKCKIELNVNGGYPLIEITGPNGNHIYFPCREGGYKEGNSKSSGLSYLWTNELNQDNPEEAFALRISTSYELDSFARTIGMNVRAVKR